MKSIFFLLLLILLIQPMIGWTKNTSANKRVSHANVRPSNYQKAHPNSRRYYAHHYRAGRRKPSHIVKKPLKAATAKKPLLISSEKVLNQPITLLSGRISTMQTDGFSTFPYPEIEKPSKREHLLGRLFSKSAKPIKFSNKTSWVASMSPIQAEKLADSLVGLIANQLPPANSTLILAPLPTDQGGNPFAPAFTLSLRKVGFALTDSKTHAPDAKFVRYLISPILEGVLVRIQVDKTEATRLYVYNPENVLVAASPFTLREVQP